MIRVQLLEPQDRISPEDWCRPLCIMSMSGGMSDSISFKSVYSGTPQNNAKWVQVKHVLGAGWFGKPCEEYGNNMEFLRGTPPQSHQLDMRDYASLNQPSLRRK